LARKLTKTDPLTFSLLKCSGFLADKADLHLQLALKTPEGMSNPQSLRSSLLAARSNHNLSERFQIALQLARAVCSVHTFGLVHKSIYPENILLFKGKEERSVLGSAFLVGFGNIRLESGQTNRRGDADWHKNIYRHPERQGLDLAKPYIMQHDIYSLGVCLLEIGLWQSFIQYDGDSPNYERSQSHSLYADDQGPHSSYRVKESLRALAGDPLRRHMGSNYARVVENCLTCLDEDNEDFGDESEFQDEEGVLIAIKYIETVRLTRNFKEVFTDFCRFLANLAEYLSKACSSLHRYSSSMS
jgi:serine/threonine protein kinase